MLTFGPLVGPPEAVSITVFWNGAPAGIVTRVLEPGVPAEGCPPFTCYRFHHTPSPALPQGLPTLAATNRDALLSEIVSRLTALHSHA